MLTGHLVRMSGWISLGSFLRGLTNEVAETNVEMETTQRMAWAESAVFYKAEAELDQSDEIKRIRAEVISEWHNQNQLAITEVKLSFRLVERGFFSRLGSIIFHPFSPAPSRYQLIPAKKHDDMNNVEIIFHQKDDGSWGQHANEIDLNRSDISVPIL